MTTEEGNKLIAVFMGIEILNDWDDPDAINKISATSMLPKQIKYHSSWSWIMPVVEKIEGKEIDLNVSVVVKNERCKIYRHKDSDYEQAITPLVIGENKIDAVYKSVIQFIQWYNEQKTKHETI